MQLAQPTAIALIDDESNPWKYTDSLLLEGAWLKEQAIEKVDPFYTDNYYEEYDHLLLWADSIQAFLDDSLQFSEWSSKEGLQNQLPEITRQGQVLELVIHLAQPKELHLDFLDLSAKPVWSKTEFFGAGMHVVKIPTKDFNWGVYSLEIKGAGLINRSKTMIRG